MAIDTQNKRRSTVANLPVPDSSIGAPDRKQVCWIYPFGVEVSSIGPRPNSVQNMVPTIADIDTRGPLRSVQTIEGNQ